MSKMFYNTHGKYIYICIEKITTMKKLSLLLSLLSVSALALVSCDSKVLTPTPDTLRVLRNPLSGWTLYLNRQWDENFWSEKSYDAMPTDVEGQCVKVSDYASTAYLRTNWNMMEPQEGEYFWNNPESRLYKLLKSVEERGMRIALRIVVDGRDQGQNTPLYVKEAGAKGFTHKVGNRECWSPYPDDPVFQVKYEKFIKALAAEFDDPDRMDFIDAYGLGKWGEAHSMIYRDPSNKIDVYNWITDLYAGAFKNTPLVINYHRVVGVQNVTGWGDPDPDSEALLESAIAKGYSLRHDAFGMNGYYQDWEKEFARKWNFQRPIIMEGGWITGAHHRYWIDPCGQYREGHDEDVRKGEYDASADACVNMMDLRAGNETPSWFRSFPLVRKFVAEGGYRLYPSRLELPRKAEQGSQVTLHHTWSNLGWGYCPNNIPQWHGRYKVAFALLDKNDKVVSYWVDPVADPALWLKGNDTSYDFSPEITAPEGNYTWAVAIVNTDKNDSVGIDLALDESLKTADGWFKLSKLSVK